MTSLGYELNAREVPPISDPNGCKGVANSDYMKLVLPPVCRCGAASSGKNMQLMAMLARRWALRDYTSL